jgi:hypothetical protein
MVRPARFSCGSGNRLPAVLTQALERGLSLADQMPASRAVERPCRPARKIDHDLEFTSLYAKRTSNRVTLPPISSCGPCLVAGQGWLPPGRLRQYC